MKCPKCGANVPYGATSCSSCGAKFKTAKCPHCGKDLIPGSPYCPFCRKDIKWGDKNEQGARTAKKPLTKRWWFWAACVLLVVGIVGNIGNAVTKKQPDKTGNGAKRNTSSSSFSNLDETGQSSYLEEVSSGTVSSHDSSLVGTELFENIYVPFATREKTGIFSGVKEYAPNSGYTYEVVEPTSDTLGSVKFIDGEDNVFISFLPTDDGIEMISSVTYHYASSNLEVTRANYSTDRVPGNDIFETHIIGRYTQTVDGLDAQREFLFSGETSAPTEEPQPTSAPAPHQSQAPDNTTSSAPSESPTKAPSKAPADNSKPKSTPVPAATESPNSPTKPVGDTVYWTPNGEKYHSTSACVSLKRSSTISSGTLDEAINSGHDEPCKLCH